LDSQFIIIMGVSGCGKSTIGSLLSQSTGIPFYDGDDFHPKANIDKMAAGHALNDEDRKEFISAINSKLKSIKASKGKAIIACSALKIIYREWLSEDIESEIKFVFLKGNQESIAERLFTRKNHFMPPGLLKSQFEILEEPRGFPSYSIELEPPQIVFEIIKEMKKSEFGLVGLGVMGKSLARNLARNGVKLSVFNRFVAKKEENIAHNFIQGYPELDKAEGFEDLEGFVQSMQRPRKVFLMIQAGAATDLFLTELLPLLNKGDIVIDGGNSHYEDTKRRQSTLKERGIHFIGTGVSGGVQGALYGPSIMPSGDFQAFKIIEPFLNIITAKDFKGGACCTYIGPEGSGHFVKMIHNGIEYAEMQIIAEVYAIMRFCFGYSPDAISEVFTEWNNTESRSYLLEITADILTKKENGTWLVDTILDRAGNKGTGNWSSITAIENGEPATMISNALFARYISTVKEKTSYIKINNIEKRILEQELILKSAYHSARKINHDQGFNLISNISKEKNWNLNLSEIARIWTNGCIIRSFMMEELTVHFKENKTYLNYSNVSESEQESKLDLKVILMKAIQFEIPVPCMSAAFNFMIAMESKMPTANIIQAQRDYFGAHTYQKLNDPSEKYYHTNWLNS
jgi:6-phosphogluconate dehydrogenase